MVGWLLLWTWMGCASQPPAEAPSGVPTFPAASLYRLPVSLQDQTGAEVDLSVFAGHPVLTSMVYASCPMACPTLVAHLTALEAQLSHDAREASRVLLVSLDPERDSPEAMAAMMQRHDLDARRWKFVRPTDPQHVEALARALDVAFRDDGRGGFDHDARVTLLDPGGVEVTQVERLTDDVAGLVSRMEGFARVGSRSTDRTGRRPSR